MPGPHDSLNRPRRELLDQVVRRGERLRLQRRSFLAMAATSVLLIAIALPLALTAGSGEQVQTVGAPVTTTTRARPRVRVYHQPTSTTKPESEAAKPGERRKPTPNPTVAGRSAVKPAAPAPTARSNRPSPTAKPAPAAEPSPIPQDDCRGTQSDPTGNRGRIAFVRGGQIYVIQPDGTQEKRLSPDGETMDSDPTWSPGGDKIAFVRAGSLFVMDGTTGAIDFRLTNPPEGLDSDPSWSPDGNKIAFIRGGDVWVVNAQSSSVPRAVTSLAGNESSPSWSPDSCLIGFISANKVHRVQDAGKRAPEPLFDGVSVNWSLSDTLAFEWVGERGPEIRVYDHDPESAIAAGRKPSWSADSSALAFETDGAIFWAPNAKNSSVTFVAVGTDPAW